MKTHAIEPAAQQAAPAPQGGASTTHGTMSTPDGREDVHLCGLHSAVLQTLANSDVLGLAERQLLVSVPRQALPYLWRKAPNGEASVAHVMEAVKVLMAIGWFTAPTEDVPTQTGPEPTSDSGSDLPQPERTPDLLASALKTIGFAWRELPCRPLLELVLHCQPPVSRQVHLEVSHIVSWLHATWQGHNQRRTYDHLLDRALAWQHHDELALLRNPFAWKPAEPDIEHEVFALEPLGNSAQLLQLRDLHEGAACRVQLGQACAQGREVWWLARPKFKPPGLDERPSLVGLTRNSAVDSWRQALCVPTPGWEAYIVTLGQSLLARANSRLGLARVHALSGALNPTPAVDLFASLREYLAHIADAKHATGLPVAARPSAPSARPTTFEEVLANPDVTLVLDTNVFLRGPRLLTLIDQAMTAQQGNAVSTPRLVVPGCVIDELDGLQMRHRVDARILLGARRTIETWLDRGWLSVPNVNFVPGHHAADSAIAQLAADLATTTHAKVAVLTYDTDLRIRVKASNVPMPILAPMLPNLRTHRGFQPEETSSALLGPSTNDKAAPDEALKVFR